MRPFALGYGSFKVASDTSLFGKDVRPCCVPVFLAVFCDTLVHMAHYSLWIRLPTGLNLAHPRPLNLIFSPPISSAFLTSPTLHL